MDNFESQTEFYKHNGFLLLPNLLDVKDLEPILSEIEDGVDQLAHTLYQQGKTPALFENMPFRRRMVCLAENAGNDFRDRLWELRKRAAKSEKLFRFLQHHRLIAALTAILGTEISWTGSFAVRIKLPESKETSSPWHQDSQYYGELTRHIEVISVWLPLVDVDGIQRLHSFVTWQPSLGVARRKTWA